MGKTINKQKQKTIIENCNWIITQAESVRKEIEKHSKNQAYPLGDYGYMNEKLTRIDQTVGDIRSFYEEKK